MRLYRNAVILLVVVGLLVGAYFVVKNKKGSDTAEGPKEETIKIIDVEKDKITDITLKNKDGQFVFTKKDKEWVLSSGGSYKVNSSKIDSIAFDLASLSALKVIEENASDLAQYGLSSPRASASAKLSDGTVKTVEIGDLTPTKDGYYVKEPNSSKVYTISSYTGETLMSGKNDFRDKTLYTFKAEDVISFAMDKDGKNVFASKKADDATWLLTSPIEGNADYSKIGPMIDAVIKTSTVSSYIEENPADLQKYGLKDPAYVLEFATSGNKYKLLLGDEKEKGRERYAKLADGNEVFTLDESAFNFLDKPLKEIMEVFAYIVNIDQVNKIEVEMDGQKTICEIQVDKDDKDKDKFTVNGKDATMKDENDNQPFRKYYQALIGITLSEIDMNAKPTGKPEITLTYYLKKAPGVMKVEFISKDSKYYYVVKNGKYSNILVEKKQFDEPEGVRETYKKLMDAMNKQ